MRELNYVRAINEALREELSMDERVIIIGEDVGLSGGSFSATRGLFQEFGGKRIIDTPISESAIAGVATGAAMAGLVPVAEIMFMDFITLAMDAVVNSAAKMRYIFGGQFKVPIVFLTQCGGGLSAGPHHSQSLEAWFCHTPGLKVVYPSTPYDVKGLLKSSIRDQNPVLFIEHKMLRVKSNVPEEEYTLPLGKADIKRPGSDVTIVTWGQLYYKVAAAAEKLAEQGIDAEIIDLRTLLPLDLDTILTSVAKTNKLVIAHEAVKIGGFGAEIASSVMEAAFDSLDAPIKRVGAAFSPIPWGPAMESAVLPQEADIIAAVKELG
ncbi:MAG: alpha-ketoacid dehydrogenase subunit beta [Desulfobacteraceae bacterium]|nr:MAG: alpha-ketoacid dehydrogenase subunit beta [Desulfobacteraceae bacterium]